MPDGKTRLFVDYDLIVSDAISFVVLCSEIKDIYENGRAAAIEGTYTDYLRHLRDMKKSRKYQRDREYWNNNQSRIAPAPQLPYTSANHGEGFARRHFYIDQETWSKGKSYLQDVYKRQEGSRSSADAGSCDRRCPAEKLKISPCAPSWK